MSLKIILLVAQNFVGPSLADCSIVIVACVPVFVYHDLLSCANIVLYSFLNQIFIRLYGYSSSVDKRNSIVLLDTYGYLNTQIQCNLRGERDRGRQKAQ